MKLLTTSSLLGATLAAAASPQQQVLKAPTSHPSHPEAYDGFSQAFGHLQDVRKTFDSLAAETKAAWSEVSKAFPEVFRHLRPKAKPSRKRSDSYWHHIVRGRDIQNAWIQTADGEKRREIDGKLENYSMRIKKVDPSKLGVDPGVKQYSGYLDDDESDKHLFYWFFESRNDPKNDPVILWLNGGPGCSSLTGLFMELGPSTINKKLEPEFNPYAWNSNASVIFVDQPVNVGYSYSSSSVSDTIAAGKDIYAMLTLFFKQFPEYSKQPFHIAGESYAGHYIPVFTSEILAHKHRNINLQSVLIGNGLTDPFTQYAYYRPMACGDGGWPAVLDQATCEAMDDSLERCQSLAQGCYDSESVWNCVPAAIYCNNALIGPYSRTGRNPYDVREDCEDNNLCYAALGPISEWLNKPEVIEAVGAEVDGYDSCNNDINRSFLFHGDWMMPFHRLIPSILKELPVLIYAGDADFICNYLGNAAWTEVLPWPGQKKYQKAPLRNLTSSPASDGQPVGVVKSSGNLTFMSIHAAGHMVPYDQPEASLLFLNRWLGGEWFEDASSE